MTCKVYSFEKELQKRNKYVFPVYETFFQGELNNKGAMTKELAGVFDSWLEAKIFVNSQDSSYLYQIYPPCKQREVKQEVPDPDPFWEMSRRSNED